MFTRNRYCLPVIVLGLSLQGLFGPAEVALERSELLVSGAGHLVNQNIEPSEEGSISGRVLDETETPLIAVPVQALALVGADRMQIRAHSFTNERGEYRLPGLAPGTYLVVTVDVMAQPERGDIGSNGASYPKRAYPETYYPGTNRRAATRLALAVGQKLERIDISLDGGDGYQVRGWIATTLQQSQFRRSPKITLRPRDPLTPRKAYSIWIRGDSREPGYSFVIRGVGRGMYDLLVRWDYDGIEYTEQTVVEVHDVDTDGIDVEMLPAGPQQATPPDERSEVKSFVERFGKELRRVRLDYPEVTERLPTFYSDYVSEDLLGAWMRDPSQAPGQIASSPWPERIEVESVTVLTGGTYEVTGRIIEITSWELTHGGAAREIPIRLTVERRDKRWQVTQYKRLP